MTDAARGHLAMLLFSALVAGSFPLGALAAPHIAPAALNALRFWIAAAILTPFVLARHGRPERLIPKAPWRHALLGGLFAIYFVTMFEGLKTAPPVAASAVFTLTPIMSAGFGWLLMRQRLTGRMALALCLGGLGALWVIFRADLSAALAFHVERGEAIFFLGCISHALYTPMVRFLNRGESALQFTLPMLVAGAIILTIWGLPDLLKTDFAALPGIVWVTLAYTAVFASATTFVLLQFATLRLPSAKVMAYTYLTPSWVILWTLALGDSLPPALILAGVGLSIVALILLLRED
ncbi:DMT family transporter [Pseudoroseicyclus sp. CXY001]|uniref:DMT family transporter n=1 Tax=Pseudoroseicyclus sp. CXY001 TaxID=3242492 RepID=UPI003570F765